MNELENRLKEGYRLTYDEAVELARTAPVEELSRLAGALRTHSHDNQIDTCSIMNARSGRCAENCKWCSQSKFHTAAIDVYPLVEAADAVQMARHNAGKGVRRFSLVTSGRGMTDAEIEKCCLIYGAAEPHSWARYRVVRCQALSFELSMSSLVCPQI